MRIGSVTLAYNDETTIGGTLKCLKPFVERQIVMLSQKPYFGKGTEPDRTEEICEDLGAEVVKGEWTLDHDQRTLGNKLLSDMDWVLTFDSDEMMTAKDLQKLLVFLSKTEYPVVLVNPEIYWRTPDYRLRPNPTYCPPIAMKPKVRFPHIRCVDSPCFLWVGGEMHHLSWCEPKDIYKKITTYAHAPEHDWMKWYNDVYLKWKEGDPVNFPYGERHNVYYNPLPKELRGYLEH